MAGRRPQASQQMPIASGSGGIQQTAFLQNAGVPLPGTMPAGMAPGAAAPESSQYAQQQYAQQQYTQQQYYQQMAASYAANAICTPPEDRIALNASDASSASSQALLARQWPDEYLWDGGDRLLPIHYDRNRIQGLESEDAVAEYYDDEGQRHVKPTNRVAIYAPRFAAVSKISGLSEGVAINQVFDAKAAVTGSGVRNRQSTVAQEQNAGTERLVVRSRGSEVESDRLPYQAEGPMSAVEQVQDLATYEDLSYLQTGRFANADIAQIAASLQYAVDWTRDENPIIMGSTSAANSVSAVFKVDELVGRKDLRKKGVLQIVKLADKKVAKTNEIVTFTIRFDNLGDRELQDIAILDNLTPRLEYVADSATCDRAGRLVTSDNGEGSLVLRWELAEPLPGKTGGVVTFQARVR